MASNVGATMNRKVARAAVELSKARRVALQKSALQVKNSVIANLPASKRLRGVGPRGARVGARYDMRGDGEVVVTAVGPVHLLENVLKPHVIEPKKRRARSTGRGGGVRLPDGNVRRKVQHPGVKNPKRPFAKGVESARPVVIRTLRNANSDAVKRGLSS